MPLFKNHRKTADGLFSMQDLKSKMKPAMQAALSGHVGFG
jgi:hypothetical protein